MEERREEEEGRESSARRFQLGVFVHFRGSSDALEYKRLAPNKTLDPAGEPGCPGLRRILTSNLMGLER